MVLERGHAHSRTSPQTHEERVKSKIRIFLQKRNYTSTEGHGIPNHIVPNLASSRHFVVIWYCPTDILVSDCREAAGNSRQASAAGTARLECEQSLNHGHHERLAQGKRQRHLII